MTDVAKRVVVKVGTSTLTGPDGRPDRGFLTSLAGEIAAVRAAGTDVVLVSSGAIAAGLEAFGMRIAPGRHPDPAGRRLGRPGPHHRHVRGTPRRTEG